MHKQQNFSRMADSRLLPAHFVGAEPGWGGSGHTATGTDRTFAAAAMLELFDMVLYYFFFWSEAGNSE